MTVDELCPEVRNGLHAWFSTRGGSETCAECGQSRGQALRQGHYLVRPAQARSTDPSTSHQAAASLDADTLRASQRAVIEAMGRSGYWAITQKHLEELVPEFSPARVRTAVSELVRLGLVNDTGKRESLASGRRAILWELTT